MPKRARTSKSHKDTSHARVYQPEFRLAAWRALSANAIALLIELRGMYRPSLPNLFVLSDRRVAELARCSRAKAPAVLEELVDKGWLKVERIGTGLAGPTSRRAAAYSLTNNPTDAGPATRLFERWQPPTTP